MITTEHIIVLVSALVASLLQIFVAPHIAIGYALPNFIAAVTLVVTLLQPTVFKHGLPFALGLVYDLVSGGPVGGMAFSLLVATAFASWFFQRSNNDTIFMGIATAALGILIVELLYGILLLVFGVAGNLFEAFLHHTLPCLVYDVIITAVLYPLGARFLSGGAPVRTEITQLH